MFTGFPASALFALCVLLPLQADVVYTNFGDGDAWSAGSGLIVTHDGAAWSSVAIAFTPLNSWNLTSIEFVASTFVTGERGPTLALFADDDGHPGSKPLELFRIDGLGQFGGDVPIVTVKSSLQPLLEGNMTYWVGMNAPRGSAIVWNQNSNEAFGIASSDGSGRWSLSDSPQGVVRIEGIVAPEELPVIIPSDPDIAPLFLQTGNSSAAPPPVIALNQSEEIPAIVPEPGSLWLMAGSLSFALFFRRQKRAGLAHQK